MGATPPTQNNHKEYTNRIWLSGSNSVSWPILELTLLKCKSGQYLSIWYQKIAESLRTVDELENSDILKGLLYSGYLKAGINILSYFVTPALRRSLTKRSRRVLSLYGR